MRQVFDTFVILLGCATVALSLVLFPAFLDVSVRRSLPRVERPYLGHLCVDPQTDGDLTHCYGMDPFGETAESMNWPAEPPAEWTR
jgi:hypothetical protein